MVIRKRWLKGKIKVLLYFAFFYFRLLHIFLFAFKYLKKEHEAIILLYHRLVDYNARSEFIHKSDAIHHDILDFKKEMLFIGKYFNIISLDTLISNIKSKKPFDKPSIAITFDDGYRDNYTLGYPILKELNFPATIYITTSLTNTNGRTWPDELEYALLHTKINTFQLPELFGEENIGITTKEERIKANIRIADVLKNIDNNKKLQLIDEIYNRLKVKINGKRNKKRRMLNWDEIKEMKNNKITFGAHTHTHPRLTQMPLKEAKKEIIKSKKILEQKLGSAVKHFAFPNGRTQDFNFDLKKYCQDIDFDSIATAENGKINITSDPYMLKREIPKVPLFIFASELVRVFLCSNKK